MSVTSKLGGLREIFAFDNKWQLIVNLLLFRKTNLIVYRLGKLEFVVDVKGGDNNGVRHTIASRMYRELLPKSLKNSGISLLDVGANAGGFPLLLASLGISIEKLVCVEMNPTTYNRLQFNIAQNIDCNTTCINAAVCGQRRTLCLLLGRGGTGDNIYQEHPAERNSAHRHSVRGILLDDACEEGLKGGCDRIDLCKIDVESAEYEIFSNSGHQCLRRCRWLVMEIHDRQNAMKTDALLAEIKNCGFVQCGCHDDVFLFENRIGSKGQQVP